MNPRLALALLLPFAAAGVQWLLWQGWIEPYVWFLFFPAAFFSAWLAGLRGGLAGGVIGALLAWYLYLPPPFSFALDNPSSTASIGLFVIMAGLFGWVFERLAKVQKHALAAGEVRFEATFEQVAVGMALVAPDGRWLRVNRKLCEIVGYTPEELLTQTFQEITHPDDLDVDLGQVRRMLAREIATYAMEKRYLRKDGRLIWINLTVSLVPKPDGTPDYFISVIEDITQRKEYEESLREANRLSGLGHWRWDLRSGQHFWSEEIYALYGRDPSLPPAIYPEVRQYFTPESWDGLSAAVEQALATGMPYEYDAEVVRPDGTHRWITARGRSLRAADAQVIALQGTIQDITVRKQEEQELRHRNEELELFNQASIDRELQMIALKREINDLARAAERPAPYDLSFADLPNTEEHAP